MVAHNIQVVKLTSKMLCSEKLLLIIHVNEVSNLLNLGPFNIYNSLETYDN